MAASVDAPFAPNPRQARMLEHLEKRALSAASFWSIAHISPFDAKNELKQLEAHGLVERYETRSGKIPMFRLKGAT